VPAHTWTPWFAGPGSKPGFDAVADRCRDLAAHVFAIETWLSSDPPMNWMCSALDGYRLVSNSDAAFTADAGARGNHVRHGP
jgi:PHP family Zn ribbon phosphoesterase